MTLESEARNHVVVDRHRRRLEEGSVPLTLNVRSPNQRGAQPLDDRVHMVPAATNFRKRPYFRRILIVQPFHDMCMHFIEACGNDYLASLGFFFHMIYYFIRELKNCRHTGQKSVSMYFRITR